MFSNRFKLQHKIYILSFFIILFFSISTIVYRSNLLQISNSVEQLNKKNEKLQDLLVLISDIEKLKRYVLTFNQTGDTQYLPAIDKIMQEFKATNIKTLQLNENTQLSHNISKLLEHLRSLEENFNIARTHVPLNFEFRTKLRTSSKSLEKKLDQIQDMNLSNKEFLQILLIRKSLLETERNVMRYFETDDPLYTLQVKQQIQEMHKLFDKTLQVTPYKNEFSAFEQLANKIIAHYRTYSMITKVLLPGEMFEINHYSTLTKELVLTEINGVKKQIDLLIEQNSELNILMNFIYIILLLGTFFLFYKIVFKPLKELTLMFQGLLDGHENVSIPNYTQDDVIGKLINVAIRFKLLNKETNDYKEHLEERVKTEIAARREKEQALIQQSKLASMGEMIGAIAHQWRQPLNELSIRIQKLKYDYAKGKIDEEFLKEFIEKNRTTIEFMSKTIDDFRNFFRIDKEKIVFHVKEAIQEVISIQNAQLKNNNISVSLDGVDFSYKGYKREFQQVLMNIFSNAKDALKQNNTTDGHISITIQDKKIIIEDNGGGIPDKVLERVFEPYYTTKEQGEGTGMGLYMSKMIIKDNMGADIEIKNGTKGAIVTISL